MVPNRDGSLNNHPSCTSWASNSYMHFRVGHSHRVNAESLVM
jgi:hypothetical protein